MVALADALKPIQTKGLFDAVKAGQSYEDWTKTATAESEFPSIAPAQVDDSLSARVTEYTKKDSPLMQLARTEGLKTANARGLLNSSMAAEAAMDSMLRYATPIASQDASQDFSRNQAARAFEYSTFAQDREIDLQEKLASWNLAAADRQAAANMLVSIEQIYASQYQSILANPNMSAAGRSAYLGSISALRDADMDLVEQMYNVDLTWNAAAASSDASGGGGGGSYPQTPAGTTSSGVPAGLDFNTWAYTVGASRQDPASMTRYMQYLQG